MEDFHYRLNNNHQDYIDYLRNIMRYRFDVPSDCFFLSNRNINTKPYGDASKLESIVYTLNVFLKKLEKVKWNCKSTYIISAADLENGSFAKYILSSFGVENEEQI